MKVLICGGRNYSDYLTLAKTLNEAHHNSPFTLVIHGAAKGADFLAGRWAEIAGVPVSEFPANWKSHTPKCGPKCRQNNHCRRAGFLRNEQMLKQGRPDLVIAFPGGPGTKSMVEVAQNASVKVVHAG